MIDIQVVRENPELIAKKSKEKGFEVDVDALLKVDEQRRELIAQTDELRAERNELTSQMKGGKPSEEQIKKGKELKEDIASHEEKLSKVSKQFEELLNSIPNPAFDDVPRGGEEDSEELKTFGEKTKGATDHVDFCEAKGWLDFERGAKVAGSKFYYLKGQLALLENALLQYGLSVIDKHEFTYLSVPHLVNARTATGTGFAPRSSEQTDEYYIENEDLGLIATAEMPITGMHADETFTEEQLPLFYAGYSPCYRKEAGTYGKHTRGLFRVHQFNKLEMYAFTTKEQSEEVHAKLLEIEEEIWQGLNIPYRVVNIAAGDLGAPAAKKYDIEYWSPVDENYRELTSCSNCTDFQARNLNIKVRRESGETEIVHTLNGTAISMARALIAVIEHYQTEDGDLDIPMVLKPFMNHEVI